MKAFLFILFVIQLFILNAFGQSDISCGEGNCNIPPATDVQYTGGGSNYTSFDLVPLSEDVNITTDEGDRPENTRASVQFNSLYTESFNADLSGQAEGSAGSVFLVTDIVDQITLMLDGATGEPGMSSSKICGENFMTGVYGVDAQAYFEDRRAADTNLSNECDVTDIEWVNSNKFMCPGGFEESPTANVDVTRYQARRQCQGNIQTTRCLRRSYEVVCQTNKVMYGVCCDDLEYSWSSMQRDQKLTPELYGAFCDATKCEELGLSGFNKTGNLHQTMYHAWEDEILNTSPEDLCRAKRDETKPEVYYTTQEYSIPGDTSSSLVPGDDTDKIRGEYISGQSNNHFRIPLPISGDANDQFLTGGNVDFPAHDDPSIIDVDEVRIKVHRDESEVGIADCLGLNGSDFNDVNCRRVVSGPEVEDGLVISFMDKNGADSNKIYVTVPEGRKVQQWGYRCCGNWDNWNMDYTFRPNGRPIWVDNAVNYRNREDNKIEPYIAGRVSSSYNNLLSQSGMNNRDVFEYIHSQVSPGDPVGTIGGSPIDSCSATPRTGQSCIEFSSSTYCTHYYTYNFPVLFNMRSFAAKHVLGTNESFVPMRVTCSTESESRTYAVNGWDKDKVEGDVKAEDLHYGWGDNVHFRMRVKMPNSSNTPLITRYCSIYKMKRNFGKATRWIYR